MEDMQEAPLFYQALVVEEGGDGTFTRQVIQRSVDDLPEGDVLVRVHYSSLNYKDALSAVGNKGVTRRYPHTPGIDAAGLVVESTSTEFRPGDAVFTAAAGALGVSAPGGYGQYIRVPAEWLLPLPRRLTLRQSMIYGTAGFTAAMCVDRLQRDGVQPERGPVLVTGATGGVGSVAAGILTKLGYQVTVVTGKPERAAMLRALGASQVLSREELLENSDRTLLHARWAGVVDTVGGDFLAAAIRATMPGGVVTACGNAASPDLHLTVFPFILRGVTLAGIDATRPSKAERARLWKLLAGRWKVDALDALAREVRLDALEDEIARSMQGGHTGRVIINLLEE
jgi:putative YhdH/YhfP family quinone oxidoreductase